MTDCEECHAADRMPGDTLCRGCREWESYRDELAADPKLSEVGGTMQL